MVEDFDYKKLPANEFWDMVLRDFERLLNTGDATVTTLANAAAFLYHALERVNWVGFYLFDGSRLALGPFCGKPACTEIAIGQGVCGKAAKEMQMIVVDDVDAFPGHVACDAASRSEIVLPIIADGKLFGVLDVDSPELARFQPGDAASLQRCAQIVADKIRPGSLL